VDISIDKRKEDNEKVYFFVSAEIGTQRSRSVSFKTSGIVFSSDDIINVIKHTNDLENLEFLPNESISNLKLNNHKGVCVFRKKNVDSLINNVIISDEKIEVESPNRRQKKDTSLPNGLKKITKTKRKRATKKKTTEE